MQIKEIAIEPVFRLYWANIYDLSVQNFIIESRMALNYGYGIRSLAERRVWIDDLRILRQ
jgi:hypothetical protein